MIAVTKSKSNIIIRKFMAITVCNAKTVIKEKNKANAGKTLIKLFIHPINISFLLLMYPLKLFFIFKIIVTLVQTSIRKLFITFS